MPALSGSMTPRWNANARGSFTGLTMEHGPAEVCRAVVEGCVYAAKDVIDRLAALGLPIDEVRVTGGGAVNEIWLQIKADATGRPTRFAEHHASPVGAACLAAVAAGWFVDLEAASASAVRMSPRVFQPNPATEAAYADGYRRYRQAFDALEPTFDQGARAAMSPDPVDPELKSAGRVAEARGRHGAIGLGSIVLGPAALDSLAGTVARLRRSERIVILEDATPMKRGAKALKPLVAGLLEGGGTVRRVVLGRADGAASMPTPRLSAAAAEAAAGAGCLVSVGSGTITDIGKEAARFGRTSRSSPCRPPPRSTALPTAWRSSSRTVSSGR